MFGVFSADYHMALATDPIPHNNASPTLLQCIVYWLQSSTFRAGAFEIPKVSSESAFSLDPNLSQINSIGSRPQVLRSVLTKSVDCYAAALARKRVSGTRAKVRSDGL